MQRVNVSALRLMLALLAPLAAVGSAQAETMYAVTDGCAGTCVPASNGVGRLLAIDTVTREQTVISNDLGAGPLQSLAAMPSGLMYSISTTGLLISIDPLTGTATNTGTQIVTPTPIYSLAANANGDLYGVTLGVNSTTQLYKINPATGATLIGNTGFGSLQALDFSPSGILYSETVSNRLVTINTTTGLATILGAVQPGLSFSSLAFDSTGTLWGVTESSGLYTIDPTTGVRTLASVGDIAGTITGIEFPVAPVPVPAAVWLFGSGLAAMVGVARRQRTPRVTE